MKRLSKNNKGMTLVETVVSFAILGILLVVAAEIIHSCTDVFYDTKTTSYGLQAAQIVATEVNGDLKDALPMALIDDTDGYYIKITGEGTKIEFIDSEGDKIYYSVDEDAKTLVKKVYKAYDTLRYNKFADAGTEIVDKEQTFTSKYIGMGYNVKGVTFKVFVPDKTGRISDLPISNYPILELEVTVGNDLFGDFSCKEYVPLYNLYDTYVFDPHEVISEN